MKQSKFIFALIASAAITSSSCSMLTDLLGSGGGLTGLTPSATPTLTSLQGESSSLGLTANSDKLGYQATAGVADPKADGGDLYGIFDL